MQIEYVCALHALRNQQLIIMCCTKKLVLANHATRVRPCSSRAKKLASNNHIYISRVKKLVTNNHIISS